MRCLPLNFTDLEEYIDKLTGSIQMLEENMRLLAQLNEVFKHPSLQLLINNY